MADQVDAYEGDLGHAVVLPESSGDMDESIATLVHLQQLQQKQEVIQLMESHTVTNADAGFRRGLEELVRDHLNTCMALASCSATVHDPGISSSSSSNMMSHPSSYNAMHDESDDTHHSLHENNHNLAPYDAAQSHESDVPLFQMSDSAYCNAHHHILDHGQSDYEHENTDQLVQEQREADSRLVDDHSSVQERPRSRILTSWAAQRAQEMITTMERQAREAELLALAGLHAVSTLDASFLRESLTRADPSLGGEARQHRRPSSIVQMWRELEEERRTERARFDPEERMATPSEPSNPSENVENFESHLNARRADGGVEQNVLAEVRTAQTQVNEDTEDLLQSQNSDFTEWELNETHRIDMHEQIEVSERHSAQTQEGEREHVRQIVQRLMTDNGIQTMSTGGQTQNRSAWLDENERERVRELAREWVRVTNEQRAGMRERGGRQRPQTANGLGHARETGLAPEDESLNENPVRGLSRSERRFLDRQVILDMLMRVERERQRELQLLVEHRAVSDFAHRHRLQSFLRGRFLRTGAVSEEERIPSSAAGELGQLRQRRAVSDLREGFRFRLETILGSQANNRLDLERANAHGTAQRRRRRETQPVVRPLVEGTPIRRGVPSEGASRGRQGITTARRVTDFQSAEESTEYNMELQELLGRRSVTNVLASEFRDRLDRLIRSFLQTQGHSPVAWDLTQTARTGPSQQQQQQQRQRARQPTQWQRQVQNQQQTVIPPPPPPPPQPAWQQELQQGTWPRPPPSLHRHSYLEVEGINDLRTDVSKLQQGMSDLQRMMETCIEMQLDLQRSVRQELAGALQQMYDGKAVPEEAIDGSKWVSVKRGICCVCCDRNIDSLLYRCGHMCTCLKCASELIRNSGKCPMCRAPIKEVVRAFTVA